METKKALITGITGQDGSYLAELLLSMGYEVHGLVRPPGVEKIKSSRYHGAAGDLFERCVLHSVGLDHASGLDPLLSQVHFDECYHLAAASFAGETLANGLQTIQTNIAATHHLLSAIFTHQKSCRFFFAGTSEMIGRAQTSPQDESAPFMPRNAYGISKLAAFHLVRNYREAHGMFCCTGLLFNHESPRRRPEFVTRKITLAVARIARGGQDKLELGNLEARRDWGYAPDYVRAMIAMLCHDTPDDYVVATGQSHSVAEFCEIAFSHVGLDWRKHVVTNPKFFRQEDAVPLRGNPARIKTILGWESKKDFPEMICEMVDADMDALA